MTFNLHFVFYSFERYHHLEATRSRGPHHDNVLEVVALLDFAHTYWYSPQPYDSLGHKNDAACVTQELKHEPAEWLGDSELKARGGVTTMTPQRSSSPSTQHVFDSSLLNSDSHI